MDAMDWHKNLHVFWVALFQVRVKKIVVKNQNFQAGSGQVFVLGKFLLGIIITHK